ncbi:hypothetical protein V2J09_010701 [Rumex salicifolius]
MATSSAIRQLLLPTEPKRFSPPASSNSLVALHRSSSPENSISFFNVTAFSSRGRFLPVVKSSPGDAAISDGDGVSLGTMKLPLDTDIPRFETLLFQWANSLCQGANIPLPLPLKIDKIQGGVRLGFVTMGDGGEVEIVAYIDCLVFPGSEGDSGPVFRAVRNGAKKDQPPPGEPRIMKSLLAALRKSVEIARV